MAHDMATAGTGGGASRRTVSRPTRTARGLVAHGVSMNTRRVGVHRLRSSLNRAMSGETPTNRPSNGPTGKGVLSLPDRLRHMPVTPAFRTTARFAGQCFLLWAVYDAATRLVEAWRLPLPANLVGLLLLLLLLGTGIVQPSMLREVTTLVTRHLPFLFVPLAVGLMAWPQLLAAHGLVLLLALLGSAAVGLVAAGAVAQLLDRRVA